MIYDYLYSIAVFAEGLNSAGSGDIRLTAYGYLLFLGLMLLRQLAFYIAFYVLRGVALYKMAKKRGEKQAYLAFIPFACFALIGKLQPKCKYVAKSKNYWIVALVFCAIYTSLSLVIDLCFAIQPLKTLIVDKTALTAESFNRNNFLLNSLDMIGSVATIVYVLFAIMAYSNLFKAYAPSKVFKYNLFSVLGYVLLSSFFVTGIFLFVNRNAEYVDYDAYVDGERRKYYGGFYNANPTGKSKSKNDDDPFSEFSKKSNDDPFSDFDDDNKR